MGIRRRLVQKERVPIRQERKQIRSSAFGGRGKKHWQLLEAKRGVGGLFETVKFVGWWEAEYLNWIFGKLTQEGRGRES